MLVVLPPREKVSRKVFSFIFELCLYKKPSLQSKIQKRLQMSDF